MIYLNHMVSWITRSGINKYWNKYLFIWSFFCWVCASSNCFFHSRVISFHVWTGFLCIIYIAKWIWKQFSTSSSMCSFSDDYEENHHLVFPSKYIFVGYLLSPLFGESKILKKMLFFLFFVKSEKLLRFLNWTCAVF